MDVKEAVRTAKKYVAELFTDETITNAGLEEVEFNDSSDNWEITIGFSRPWDYEKNRNPIAEALANPLAERSINQPTVRSYKLVCINDNDGQVVSLKDRILTTPQ
ncbi:MAG: hypothetical protein F4201_01300 [Nitrospira sp. SB0677_bin_15]|nr:hypothetical protein [Nitrospira sp. SB0667_bin_9]MYG39456.1 hypothetical protein [Nitrospira sp. SB0677_bin_15]MYH03235.1 hypothetical protein [Nitrospira sp. SB0675_bin_23]MYJ23376.1 hypothetical protein [Nitrospira sp. SB0673_bin_12]